MICPNCAQPVPSEAIEPRFCVACGYPVTQPCPYETFGEITRLPLRCGNGRALAACPTCHGLFQTCSDCSRLHRLEDNQCLRPGCAGHLIEPTEAFPSGRGSLDGRRTARIRGRFPAQVGDPVAVQDTEEFQHLVYRYGRLVGVSRRNLAAYTWNGAQWRRENIQTLTTTGQLAIRSLLLDDGYVFFQAEDRALAVSLATLTTEQTIPERGFAQARREKWWVRVIEGTPGGKGHLAVTDSQTWQTQTYPLPVPAAAVADMAIAGKIYLATRGQGLLAVSPTTGQIETLSELPITWTRLAVSETRLIALGYDEAHRTVLLGQPFGEPLQGPYLPGEGFLADFAWQEDDLILAQAAALASLPASQLSQKPQLLALPAGQAAQPGFLALADRDGERRLLMSGVAQNLHRLQLVEPFTGAQTPIGGALLSPPLLCIADNLLVVASREGVGMKLRSYAFGEIEA